MSSNTVKRIGIFGGSFNPIHTGHLAIAEAAIQEIHLDKVIFVPCNIHPAGKQIQVSQEHRLNMLNLAIEQSPIKDKCLVSEYELNNKQVSYTIHTIKHLVAQYLTNEHVGLDEIKFYLILGEDNLYSLTNWLDWQDILHICQLIIYPRECQANNSSIPQTIHEIQNKFAQTTATQLVLNITNHHLEQQAKLEQNDTSKSEYQIAYSNTNNSNKDNDKEKISTLEANEANDANKVNKEFIQNKLYRELYILKQAKINIASHQIRKLIKSNNLNILAQHINIPAKVLQYIKKHALYT